MQLSLSAAELKNYVARQTEFFFPDGYHMAGTDVDAAFRTALDRLEVCLDSICQPGYHNERGECVFSHLHADQYAQFLYYFGNTLWLQSGNRVLCDKLLQLNRVLHNIFISYKCGLPDHFFLGHPFGTILRNASYHDFLVVMQGVTVNTERDEQNNPAPVLGKGLFLGAHAKIIGNKSIGDRVSLGVDSFVYQREVPDDSVVINDGHDSCIIRPRKKPQCKAQEYFNLPI